MGDGWRTGCWGGEWSCSREASARRLAQEPPVLCRAWCCQAVEGSEPAVHVAPCSVLRLCTRGRRCPLPAPSFPAWPCPGWPLLLLHLDVMCPGFASCLWPHGLSPFPLARTGCLLEDKDEQCPGAITWGSGQCCSGEALLIFTCLSSLVQHLIAERT